MTQKFGRNYRLTIYPRSGGDPILITMPTTIKISLERSWSSKQNPLELQIFNLSEAHRNSIYQDWFDYGTPSNANDAATGIPLNGINIILEAGYGSLYRVFEGLIWKASSAREGVNIVTRISAFSNSSAIATTRTFQTMQSGQTLGQILQTLIGQFPNLPAGNELNYSTIFNRPVVLNGFTWNLLKQYSNANVYIDNGKIYVLRDNEALNSIVNINDDTGILETPRRWPGSLFVTTLFEPSVNVGGQIKLQSKIQPSYNGTYAVRGIRHDGTISAAVCGKLTTVFELQAPNPFNGFTTVNQL
jgi:hypothetical protein